CASCVRVYDASYSQSAPGGQALVTPQQTRRNDTMKKLRRFVGLVVIWGWVSGTGTVHANAVTDWHAIAVQALATTAPPRALPLTFLDSIGIPILRLALRPGDTRARWGR